jgi:hypothetical protein
VTRQRAKTIGAAVTLDELSEHLTEDGLSCAANLPEAIQRTVGELMADPNTLLNLRPCVTACWAWRSSHLAAKP